MPVRLRSAGGGSVQLNSPVALATDVSMEVPGYDGAKLLTDKTPGVTLQTVGFQFNNNVATSSATYSDLGMSCSITLQKASNKVLLLAKIPFYIIRYGLSIRVKRNGALIYTPTALYEGYIDPATSGNLRGHWVANILDTPGSTLATYTFEMASYNGTVVTVNESGMFTSMISLQEIAA